MNKLNIKNILIAVVLMATLTITLSVVKDRQSIIQHAQEQQSNQASSQFNKSQVNSPNITLQPRQYAYTSPNNTIPPVLTITNPASGTLIKTNTSITISANAADTIGVSRVEFLVNGGIICTADSQPYICTWAIPTGSNITYTLVVRAYDSTGNIASKGIVVRSF